MKKVLLLGVLALVSISAAALSAEAATTPLVAVKYGLPSAKEGKPYRFSIAGAATGGVKPYHCAPAESFGPLWAWLHVGSNCVLSGTAPTLPQGTTRRVTALRFKLTDSESPPKTVTLDPLTIQVLATTFLHPFDGTWKITTALTITASCPGHAPIVQTKSASTVGRVINDTYGGHPLSVSASGTSGTVTYGAGGVTENLTFEVAGAVTSVRGTVTAPQVAGAGGCTVKSVGVIGGSRISP